MLRSLVLTLAVLSLAGCSGTSAPNPRTVESNLASAGFRGVVPDTPKKQEAIKRLPARKLTEASRSGEAAYQRYDELAQARDNVKSDTADRKMLTTVESNEETPPDAWFWQDALPEYFPQ